MIRAIGILETENGYIVKTEETITAGESIYGTGTKSKTLIYNDEMKMLLAVADHFHLPVVQILMVEDMAPATDKEE